MGKRTGRIAVLGSLVTAAALCFGTTAAHAVVSINVGSGSGNDGDIVSIEVTLNSGADMVSGTQNDITFDANAPIQAKANGKPDCTVNPDIDKAATSFSFRPSGCGAAPAAPCTGVRALVLSTGDTTAIPNGSLLYTCKVKIGASAPDGTYPLTCSTQGSSNPKGAAFNGSDRVCSGDGLTKCSKVVGGVVTPDDTRCTTIVPPDTTAPGGTCSVTQTTTSCPAGQVTVGAGEGATPTPSPSPTATTPSGPVGPSIVIGSAQGAMDGDVVSIDITLQTAGFMVSGTQNDITFDATNAPIQAKANGKPDCTVNPDIEKAATSFSFRPSGCGAAPAAPCTGVRALVLSTGDTTPIPDGSVLYTCKVKVGATAPDGMYPLTCSTQGSSNPKGAAFNGSDRVCSGDGLTKCSKVVGGVVTPDDTRCTTIVPPDTTAPGGTCSVTQPPTSCPNGAVQVGPGVPVSFTPTTTPTTGPPAATATLTPTTPPTATRTPTTGVSATPTNTGLATATPTPSPKEVAKLSADIGANDTTIPVDNIDGFGDSGKIQIDNEIITYSGRKASSGTGSGGGAATPGQLLLAVRGQDNTTKAAHTEGTAVKLFPGGGGGQEDDGCDCRITTKESSHRAWLLLIPAAGLLVMRRKRR